MKSVLLVTKVATEKQQGNNGQSEQAVGTLQTTTVRFSLSRDGEICTLTLPIRNRRYWYRPSVISNKDRQVHTYIINTVSLLHVIWNSDIGARIRTR